MSKKLSAANRRALIVRIIAGVLAGALIIGLGAYSLISLFAS